MAHGVFPFRVTGSATSPITALSGIPLIVGIAPIQMVGGAGNELFLINSYDEGVEKLGYSDDWWDTGTPPNPKYTICEFLYSHFKLYGMGPVIVKNVLDPATMYTAVSAADLSVTDHAVYLTYETIDNVNIVVKAAGGTGDPYVKGTDYNVVYTDEYCVIQLISTGSCYAATSLNVAYRTVKTSEVTTTIVKNAFTVADECLTTLGVVPDILVAPGFSDSSLVAAAMATKAAGINGMFTAKALIDISTAESGGADVYSEVSALKITNLMTDENEIACWPLVTKAGKTYHFSTHLAGLIASVDSGNGDIPYESPSNKTLQIDGLCTVAGVAVYLTKAQADTLNAAGVVTALNFNGYRCWGNYTACYPVSDDQNKYFIPNARMYDWVNNTAINTLWDKVDKPLNRRLIDSVIDALASWINGLYGAGYIYGGRVEFRADENTAESISAGIIKLHIYIAYVDPAQEIDVAIEYDSAYVDAALTA